MGFLDSAREKLSNTLGEETVGIVSFEENKDPKKPKPRKESRIPRINIPTSDLTLPEKPERPKKEVKVKEKREKRKSKKEEDNGYNLVDTDVTLHNTEIYEDSHIEDFTETFNSPIQDNNINSNETTGEVEKYGDIKPLEKGNNRLQDVLEVLGIQETFVIAKNVFLPEDISHVVFDLQTPFGYEQGQVNAFVEKTQLTVKYLVDLLRIRNSDVAKLATVVDRLQVDMNNLRYQTEINNGINIMPTMDEDDLEGQLVEAKLSIKRLEDEINRLNKEKNESEINEKSNKFKDLQDQYSILYHENQDLREEIEDLKTIIKNSYNKPSLPTNDDEIILPPLDDDEDNNLNDNNTKKSHGLPSLPYIRNNNDSNDEPVYGPDGKLILAPEDEEYDLSEELLKNWNNE